MADPISATVAAIGSAITAASGAAAGATLALTGSATLAAAAGNLVLGLASWQTALTVAGFAASALLTPQVNIEGRPTDWRADPNAGIPFVMGERATSGIIVHRDAYGLDNRLQSIVTVYSGAGPIQSFDQFYADEVAMSFDANGEATNGGNFSGNMWLYTTPGNQPQSAALANNAALNSQIGGNAFEGWSTASKISGKAHALLTLRQDSKLETYAGGIPRTRFKMRGIKMYDPRLDSTVAGGSGSHRVADQSTYAYSENPAIAALNWCLGLKENGVVVGGIGATVDGIDLPAFIEWANVCDANGWTVSAVPTSADDKHQVLLALMQAGGARYSRFQGKMSCIVRTPRTSVATLSADDTAGPFEVDLNADRLSRTNTITPRCVMESHDWEMVAQDPVSEASYVTADGGERSRGIDYPYVSIKATNANKNQPAELAAYAIVDSRESIAGTVPLKPWGAQIEPGDVFTIDEPGFLLDGVELLCLRREFDLANNIVRISFISETAGKHTYALGLDPTPPTAPNLTAPDIYTVDAPGAGVWSAAVASGNQPAIIVTGDADQLSARQIIVEYRTENDPSDGQPWAGTDQGWVQFAQSDISTSTVDITGLEPNTAYEVSVRYISQFGIIGDRRNLGAVTTGGLTATNSDQLQGFDADYFDDQIAAVEQSLTDTAAALDADAENIVEAANSVRGALNDSRRKSARILAETTASLSEILSNQGSAADNNASRVLEIKELEVRADNADASFSDILALNVSPTSALAINTTTLRTEFEFEVDPANPGSLAAQVDGVVNDLSQNYITSSDISETYVAISNFDDEFAGSFAAYEFTVGAQTRTAQGHLEAQDNALSDRYTKAEVDSVTDALAETDRASANTQRRILAETAATLAEGISSSSALADKERALFERVTFAEVGIASNTARYDDILTLSVDQSSALITRFESLEVEFQGGGRVADIEDDLDPNQTGSLAHTVAGIEQDYLVFANASEAFSSLGLTLNASTFQIDEDIDLPSLEARAKTVVRQASEPTPANYEANDLWYDTDDGDKAYVHDGSAWQALGIATESWANQRFTTSSDVTSAISAYEFTLNAELNTIAGHVATSRSQISDLDAATAEADRAQARRLSRTLAEIAANTAKTVDATNALVDDQRSEVTRTTQLRSEFDDVSADVGVLASAYTDGAGNALASFSVVTAASGSNPAIVQLKSGDGASDAAIVADRVMLGNLGTGEDEVRPVFLAQNGEALFNEQITIYDDIVTPTTAVILGPNIGADGLTLWAGAASDASSPTLANAQLALGASAGARVNGTVLIDGYEVNRLFSSSPDALIGVDGSDTVGKVIARADIEGVRSINSWALMGSVIDFAAAGTGTMQSGDIANFRLRAAVANPQASPPAIGDSITGFTSGGAVREWDISFDHSGDITIKSALIAGAPAITVDDLNDELGSLIVRYGQTGDCYAYLSAKWMSTNAAETAGIVLRFSTSTRLAVTNLLNRNTGA
jgi:hypothetical protein